MKINELSETIGQIEVESILSIITNLAMAFSAGIIITGILYLAVIFWFLRKNR